MKCIYCLEDKPEDAFRKVEHVIPQAFGVFKNNFTLIRKVCDECNKFFGDNLELALARDSFEGGLRFSHNVKAAKEFKSVGRKSRLVIKVDQGTFRGAYVYREYCSEQDRVIIKPLPQVGFLNGSTGQYDYFLLDNLPTKEILLQQGYNLTSEGAVRIFGQDLAAAEQFLSTKGFTFKARGFIEPEGEARQDWKAEIEGTIDAVILRAISKIGFNYLAHWNDVPFMLHSDFDAVRRFIRWGEKPEYRIAVASSDPTLSSETPEGRRVVGHILTVNWAGDGVSIMAQVSLFNWMRYNVSLARGFRGEHRDIRKGHLFSPHNQMILELGAREQTLPSRGLE